MYKINTSFVVDYSAHDKWLDIIKGKYIPFLRENGFSAITLSRVLSNDASDHFIYSLLIDIENMDQYHLLKDELFKEYTVISEPMFGDKVTWFTSLMKIIDL